MTLRMLDPIDRSRKNLSIFYCSRSGKTALGRTRADQGPQHTHYISQLLASWSDFSPHVRFFHIFWKTASRPQWEAHFCRSAHRIFHKKYHRLDPPRREKEPCTSFCSLLSLLCPNGSAAFRSMALLKNPLSHESSASFAFKSPTGKNFPRKSSANRRQIELGSVFLESPTTFTRFALPAKVAGRSCAKHNNGSVTSHMA